MSILVDAYTYAAEHSDQLIVAFREHLRLVIIPLSIALAVGIPLGLWSARSFLAAQILINGFNGLRVIPSLAVLFLAIPYFGLSFQSAAIALTILAIPPILINTNTAFRTIDPTVCEAAVGMGMNLAQRLRRVEVPLAFPVILAGVKTATVEVIASATLAAFIGAGGFGTFIVLGFSLYDNAVLLVGAIPVALLAISAEILLSLAQRLAQPPHADTR